MAEGALTRRRLNRATLARQLLLERAHMPIVDAVGRLAGMQMQEELPVHVGLWSRLTGVTRETVVRAFDDGALVRGTAMRGTLYAFAAEDFPWVRSTIGPGLAADALAYVKKTASPVEVAAAIDHLTGKLADGPLTADRMRDEVAALLPGSRACPERSERVRTVAYAARMALPLVQLPGGGRAGVSAFSTKTPFALAETWLGRPLPTEPDVPALVRRYLAAYGPATAADVGAWTGLPGPAALLKGMEGELVTYRGEGKTLLYDVPGGLLPDPEIPAPPRLLPAFDNLLLSHKDRTRVVTDEHRARLYQKGNLRILASVLVDGEAVGTWRLETKRRLATLTVTPFVPIVGPDRSALTDEAEALARFLEPGAREWGVAFEEA